LSSKEEEEEEEEAPAGVLLRFGTYHRNRNTTPIAFSDFDFEKSTRF